MSRRPRARASASPGAVKASPPGRACCCSALPDAGRKRYSRNGPAAFAWLEIEASAVQTRNALDDGKPQPCAPGARSRRLAASKRTFEALDFAGDDAGAAVGDFESDCSVAGASGDFNRWAAVGESVVEQIGDEPRHGGYPQRCRRQHARRKTHVASFAALPVHQRRHNIVQIAKLQRTIALVPGEVEKLADDL